MVYNRFCSNCGSPTQWTIPQGDERHRSVCMACGTIHYENPKMVVGCIVEDGERLLFCRRAIDPQYGKWTLPAGFLENGETAAQGALRETYEESGAQVELLAPYRLFDLPKINQLYLLFRARLASCPFEPTMESSAVSLLHHEDIPWDNIAFNVIKKTLEHYVQDFQKQEFSFQNHVIAL